MKKNLLILIGLILSSISLLAQAPDSFNYQALIKNSDGEALINSEVNLKIEVIKGTATGEIVYAESHLTNTDSNGIIHLKIGQGQIISGEFSDIKWGENNHFTQSYIDIEGGNNFETIAVSQLLSVPYALHANSTNSFSGSTLELEGQGLDVDLIRMKNNNFSRIASFTASNGNDPTSVFVGYRSRGTIEQPLNIAPNNRITGLYGGSYYNGDFEISTAVEMIAGEQAGSNGVSSYIKFGTTNIGSIIRTEKMRIAENGNVGIGNTAPQRILDVSLPSNGNEQNNGISLNRNNGYLNLINGTMYQGHFQARISAQSTHNDSPGLVIAATPNSDIVNSNAILLRGGEFDPLVNSDILRVQNNLNNLMTVKSNGNVGIGTTNPDFKLDINGSLNADSIFLNGEPLNLNQNIWSANEMSTFYTDGYVGIGNTTPQKLLDISLPATGVERDNGISLNRNDGFLNLINGTLYDGYFQARISAKSTHDDSPGLVITATPNSDIANSNAILLRGGEFNSLINSDVLRVQNYLEDLMTVKSDGNVGIGTTTPKSKLHVTSGDIYIENANNGVIMTSPNGNCWRMTVDNVGNPTFNSITCPQ